MHTHTHTCSLSLVTELLLFDNLLERIPSTLFDMKSLEMLNLDKNHIIELPSTVSMIMVDSPPLISLTSYPLVFCLPQVGKCRTLHVLSMRDNDLTELPEELGQLEELTVLDVVGNRLRYLPYSLTQLKLDALWIDGSQVCVCILFRVLFLSQYTMHGPYLSSLHIPLFLQPQPLIALMPDSDPDDPEKKRLTCIFLPQHSQLSPSLGETTPTH